MQINSIVGNPTIKLNETYETYRTRTESGLVKRVNIFGSQPWMYKCTLYNPSTRVGNMEVVDRL